jgi:hypothetical protein
MMNLPVELDDEAAARANSMLEIPVIDFIMLN